LAEEGRCLGRDVALEGAGTVAGRGTPGRAIFDSGSLETLLLGVGSSFVKVPVAKNSKKI